MAREILAIVVLVTVFFAAQGGCRVVVNGVPYEVRFEEVKK